MVLTKREGEVSDIADKAVNENDKVNSINLSGFGNSISSDRPTHKYIFVSNIFGTNIFDQIYFKQIHLTHIYLT